MLEDGEKEADQDEMFIWSILPDSMRNSMESSDGLM